MTGDQQRRDPVDVAREELTAGRAWAARDRLAGCLAHRPTDADVLDLLGRAWAALGEPAQAGRWWYLVDRDDDEAVAARAAFHAQHDGDPVRIVSGLRVFAPRSSWVPGEKPSWRRTSDAVDERWYDGVLAGLFIVTLLAATVGVWLIGVFVLLDRLLS